MGCLGVGDVDVGSTISVGICGMCVKHLFYFTFREHGFVVVASWYVKRRQMQGFGKPEHSGGLLE